MRKERGELWRSISLAAGWSRIIGTQLRQATTSSSMEILPRESASDRRAVHGGVLPSCPRVYRRLLLAGQKGTRTLFASGFAAAARRAAFRTVPRKAR